MNDIKIEDFSTFSKRIEDDFKKDTSITSGEWTISSRLRDKVTQAGSFAPFYGYTSVYMLSDEDRAKCQEIQDEIIGKHGNMLIQLPESTFHLTAHEFCNEYTVSHDRCDIDQREDEIDGSIRDLFHSLHEQYGNQDITLNALGPSTHGSDAISIKFVPATCGDSDILQTIFHDSENIWQVGKAYTPHVSLAYFRTEQFPENDVELLYEDIREIVRKTAFSITFSADDLVYQRHYDMKDFRKILSVSEA